MPKGRKNLFALTDEEKEEEEAELMKTMVASKNKKRYHSHANTNYEDEDTSTYSIKRRDNDDDDDDGSSYSSENLSPRKMIKRRRYETEEETRESVYNQIYSDEDEVTDSCEEPGDSSQLGELVRYACDQLGELAKYPSVRIRSAPPKNTHTASELSLARFMARQSKRLHALNDIIKHNTKKVAEATTSDEYHESAEAVIDVNNKEQSDNAVDFAYKVSSQEYNASQEYEIISGVTTTTATEEEAAAVEPPQQYDPTRGIENYRPPPPYTPSPQQYRSNDQEYPTAEVQQPIRPVPQYYSTPGYPQRQQQQQQPNIEPVPQPEPSYYNNTTTNSIPCSGVDCTECNRFQQQQQQQQQPPKTTTTTTTTNTATTKEFIIATTATSINYMTRVVSIDSLTRDHLDILEENLKCIYDNFKVFANVKFGLTGLKLDDGQYMRFGDHNNIGGIDEVTNSFLEIPFMGGHYGYAFIEFEFGCEPVMVIYNKKVDILQVVKEIIFKSRNFWNFKIQSLFTESERAFVSMDNRYRTSGLWNSCNFYSHELRCFHPHSHTRLFFVPMHESKAFVEAIKMNNVYTTSCITSAGSTYKEYNVNRNEDYKQVGFGLDLFEFGIKDPADRYSTGRLNVRPIYDKNTGNAFALVTSAGTFGPMFDTKTSNPLVQLKMEFLFGKPKINMSHLQLDGIFDVNEFLV